MKQFFYLSTFCILALAACTESFKKGGKGLEYKIIADGSGKTVMYGNYLQLQIAQIYKGTKDSVIGNSRDYMPRINIFDSIQTPPEYFQILKKVRKGDSLVIRILVDSFYKTNMDKLPSNMKKGQYIYTTLKILNIFETREQADSANKAEYKLNRPKMYAKQKELYEKEVLGKSKDMLAKDDKLISDYLTKNNIKATKTDWGTYIAVQTEGTGPTISFTDVATVNYTGKSFDSSKVFDSNVDPKFKHVEPYQVSLAELGGEGGVIIGWSDALLHLKKGAKATIYIPSTLAYGTQGRGPEIGPDAILVFDMEVLGVDDQDDVMKRQEELQKKMLENQKRVQDSTQQAQQNPKK